MLPPPDPVREAAEFEVSRKYHDFLKAGDDLLQQGDSEGAIAQYRQGLEVKPDPGAWIKIGDILWQQGKQQAAIDAYRAAVNVPPASISAAHEKLGDAYAALGRDDDAILEYQTALTRQIDKQDYFKLALLYVKHRQFEQAGLMYNQGMHWMDSDEQSVFPSSFSRDALGQRDFAATAHVALGLIRSGYGYDDEAITEMRTALRLQPDSAVVHYFLAQSLQKKGGRQGHSVLGIR